MTNQEMKLQKIKKSCETTKKVLNIVRVIFIAFMVICIVCGIGVFAMSNDVNTEIAKQVEAGNANIDMNISFGGLFHVDTNMEKAISQGRYAFAIGSTCAIAGGLLLMVVIVTNQLIKIFTIIGTSESPFSDEVIRKLKKIFIILAVFELLFVEVGAAVLMALIFWCILNIFEYGATLQTEVDETL